MVRLHPVLLALGCARPRVGFISSKLAAKLQAAKQTFEDRNVPVPNASHTPDCHCGQSTLTRPKCNNKPRNNAFAWQLNDRFTSDVRLPQALRSDQSCGQKWTAVVSVCKLHGAFSANKYTKVRRWSFFAIGWQFQELGRTIQKKTRVGMPSNDQQCVRWQNLQNPKSKKRRQWGERMHNEYIIIIRNPKASIKNRYESSRIENPDSCRKVWILHLRRPVLDTRLWKRTISGAPACFKYLQKLTPNAATCYDKAPWHTLLHTWNKRGTNWSQHTGMKN